MDIDLDSMNKEQLRAQALERKLPVSGTNEDLIERIRQHDLDHEDDPLGDDYRSETSSPVETTQAQDDATPESAQKPKPTSYVTLFPCPGELSTGMHHEFCDRTIARAQADGNQIRGVAHRIDFTNKGGKRYAVYEVHLARERAGRRY